MGHLWHVYHILFPFSANIWISWSWIYSRSHLYRLLIIEFLITQHIISIITQKDIIIIFSLHLVLSNQIIILFLIILMDIHTHLTGMLCALVIHIINIEGVILFGLREKLFRKCILLLILIWSRLLIIVVGVNLWVSIVLALNLSTRVHVRSWSKVVSCLTLRIYVRLLLPLELWRKWRLKRRSSIVIFLIV